MCTIIIIVKINVYINIINVCIIKSTYYLLTFVDNVIQLDSSCIFVSSLFLRSHEIGNSLVRLKFLKHECRR